MDELVNTEFQPWQTNPHCLRSIYHNTAKLKDARTRDAHLKAEERESREAQRKARATEKEVADERERQMIIERAEQRC